jgi:hypothetical protein
MSVRQFSVGDRVWLYYTGTDTGPSWLRSTIVKVRENGWISVQADVWKGYSTPDHAVAVQADHPSVRPMGILDQIAEAAQ